jgi:DNA-binding response OmpR family regulator
MDNTVLIIDDDADTRDMITVGLLAEGWKVKAAHSLYGGLYILAEDSSISCVLLDYNLPGMPMEDFLKQVHGVAPKVNLILVTAADRVAEKARTFGFKWYLAKPFDFAHLRAALKDACPEHFEPHEATRSF